MKLIMDAEFDRWSKQEEDYDRLTAQVDELKDFVKQLAHAKVYSVEVFSRHGGENSMDCLCDSWKEKANQLLTRIGEDK